MRFVKLPLQVRESKSVPVSGRLFGSQAAWLRLGPPDQPGPVSSNRVSRYDHPFGKPCQSERRLSGLRGGEVTRENTVTFVLRSPSCHETEARGRPNAASWALPHRWKRANGAKVWCHSVAEWGRAWHGDRDRKKTQKGRVVRQVYQCNCKLPPYHSYCNYSH